MGNDLLLRLLLLVVFISSSACVNSDVVSLPTETAIPLTRAQSPSPTVISPTSTATPVTTTWANEACWERQSLDKVETKIAGSLFYVDNRSKEYMLLDLGIRETKGTDLFEKRSTFVHVSPYGEYVAFDQTGSGEILLFSKAGEKNFSVPSNTDFWMYLNNSQMLFGYSDEDIDEDQLHLLNPETGDWTVKTIANPRFPEVECVSGLQCNDHYAVYSPDLKYVFYVVDDLTNYLFDITDEQLVENKSGGYSFGKSVRFPDAPDPVWKKDASAVTISDTHNYYNVETDGEVVQLTRLNNLFPDYYSLMNGKWSSTGRYFAFMEWRTGPSLYIFDTYTSTLINPCVSDTPGSRLYWEIIWSPTGDMLAIEIGEKVSYVNDPPGTDGYRTIVEKWPDTLIVDLAHQLIYQVPNTMRNERQSLLGWLSW